MTDWISHNVGGCPVGHHVNVIVKYGSGERKTGMAGFFDWTIAGGKCGAVADIVEYQIVDAAPASTDWIEWNGGECPVAEGYVVEYKLRGNSDASVIDASFPAVNLQWNHENEPWDIVAYRLVDAPRASTGAPSALATQVGGDHYKGAAIQPVEFCVKNKMESLESNIVKRAFRHDKPTGKGREDVEKIIHEARLLLELKYGAVA